MTKKAYSLRRQEEEQRRKSDLDTNATAIELKPQDFREAKPTMTNGRGLNEGSANVSVTGPAPHDQNGQTRSVQDGMKTKEGVMAESASVDLPSVKIVLPASALEKSGSNGTTAGRHAGWGKGEEEEEEEDSTGCCGKKRKEKLPAVGVFELFRYASPLEIVMMLVGTLGAMTAGCAQPVNMIVMGRIVDVFIVNMGTVNGSNQTYGEKIEEEVQPLVVYFLLVGVTAFVSGYTALSLWTWAGERQITNIRKRFFRGVLRQDIGWFDTHEVGELNSRFSDDMQKIGEGLGDKVPTFIQWCSTWLCAYVVSFVKGWKLALAVFAFSPLFIAVSATVAKMLRSMAVKELKAYAKAGAVAEQALRAIRTVQAFQGQEKEHKKYEDNLTLAKKVGTRKGLVLGMGIGLFWAILFLAFAASFYFGVILIQNDGLQPGNVIVVFFGVLIGSMSLGHAFPNLETFSNARAAAVKVFEIMDLHPVIDITSPAGKTPKTLSGAIEFKDVYFRYPARPEVQVLKGLNLTVSRGQTVALVGASGCGKSTTVQLLQRFYDPESGQVMVDGHDIKDLNLKWLRDQIGVVSQEPVLFAATIADNIGYGHPDATQDQIKTAAIEANAHDFIVKLPQGYDTMVGERGAQLSGGQKQRIAIARALVKNPRILLLDEATSALDHESEALVQEALEKAEEGRTTIVIAHRLSTIRNADKIVSISQGRKREEGVHEELMELGGLYAQLVNLQMRAEEEDGDSLDIVEDEEDEDEDEDPTDPIAPPKVALKVISASGTVATRTSLRLKRKGKKESADKGETEKKEKKEKEEKEQPASFKRLLQLNSPDWLAVLVGTVMSVICGLSQPCFAFVFSEFLRVFSVQDKDEQLHLATLLSGIMAGVGVAVAILRITSGYCFGKAGAELTARIRSLAFLSMIKQDMSYYDSSENQVGTLTTRLSSDAAMVQGATGSKIAAVLEASATIVAALTIAFIYGWKLALVILAFMPVMMLAGKVQGRVVSGSAKSGKSHIQEAGKICSEAVDNIRTVASLNRADIFTDKLDHLLDGTSRSSVKTAQLFGITYGISISIQYFALSAAFTYGSHLVASGEMQFYHIFRVFSAIIMGGTMVGRNSSFGVDYTKARMAAGRLFAIIDKQPKIDVDQTGAKQLEDYSGQVAVHEAVFHYPTRDTVRVLDGLSLDVEPGQTLALVGSSGCGKSTVLQLLQRFYDTDSGAVMINGHDLKTLNLRWFRKQLGIVSQEPILFDDSIAANIAYGDNSRQVAMDEIIAAARAANIHSFIDGLPQGYDTSVGDKGTQMSGGQKQRIAIARALVRQPKVLLLDEATSALDTESERIVQEALDKAREGRTCIVIAHRLTTIQTADRIAVINEGRVVEMGTHSQLVAREGAYFRLLQAQNAVRKSPKMSTGL